MPVNGRNYFFVVLFRMPAIAKGIYVTYFFGIVVEDLCICVYTVGVLEQDVVLYIVS